MDRPATKYRRDTVPGTARRDPCREHDTGDLTGGLPGATKLANGGYKLDFLSEAHVFNIASHAAVRCGSAVASGGKCRPGALSGAAGSFATPLSNGLNPEGRLVVTTVAGGVASVAGGGKFGNGAVTAAFGYLFNACLHDKRCWTTPEERNLIDSGDALGYWTKACAGGDDHACFSKGVVAESTLLGSVAVDRLKTYLALSYPEGQWPAIIDNIEVQYARAYADYLPATRALADFPESREIAKLHWNVFKQWRLPPETFGGTPWGARGPVIGGALWCPNCKK